MKLEDRPEPAGFTRLDLSAVLATVALLAGLVLTTAGVDRQAIQGQLCRSNLRQLMRAWSLYTLDNRDRIPLNPTSGGNNGNWCDNGFIDLSPSPGNWNPNALTNAQLWRYASQSDLWRCPADPSTVRPPGRGDLPRIRSYSMNATVGNSPNIWAQNYRSYLKLSDFTLPGPERTFVLIDEHPGSINDGAFAVEMDSFGANPSNRRWVDLPANHHQGGAHLTFADGHLETWRWQDARTQPAYRPGVLLQLNVSSPNNPDIPRLQAVTTARP
jgi:prepilin-type processing-associated H-X9-DG protein